MKMYSNHVFYKLDISDIDDEVRADAIYTHVSTIRRSILVNNTIYVLAKFEHTKVPLSVLRKYDGLGMTAEEARIELTGAEWQ